MSSPREHVIRAMAYENPEVIPVIYAESKAGLHTHKEPLLKLFNRFPRDNAMEFNEIPKPDPKCLDADGNYRERITDEWGTVWQHLIFGVAGHPTEYPFKDWNAAADFVFPEIPSLDSEAFRLAKEAVETKKETFFVVEGWVSIFEKLHALRPIDDLFCDLIEEDPALLDFLERLVEHQCASIDYLLATGVDAVMFADDWGTQNGQLISTDLFRTLFKPAYGKMFSRVRAAGKKIFFHSCGKLDALFDEMIELGVNVFWIQIPLYESDEFFQKCKDRGVSLYIHPDRQNLIPLGTPDEIERKIKAYAETFHQLGGGGMFFIEMENDAPFENVKSLIESIYKYRETKPVE